MFAFRAFACALLAVALSPTAIAQERLHDYQLRATFEVDADGASLRYAEEACWWECGIAYLRCSADARVSVSVSLPHESVVRWFNAVPDSDFYPLRATLRSGGSSEPLLLDGLAFSEFDGTWWATIIHLGSESAWLVSLAEADEISVRTPAFEVRLSSAIGDPEARAAFVEACLAM